MKKYVIIVAGGKGMRMGSEIPKQFMCIGTMPILMHTIRLFFRYDPEIELLLVLPKEQQLFWQDLCKEHAFLIEHQVIDGGKTRFESVQNGLKFVKPGGLVAVHDGVRPFVSLSVIDRCFKACQTQQAVIPVIDLEESIRQITENESIACDRSIFKLVQTPQVFHTSTLLNAYKTDYQSIFTDDASVVEFSGIAIQLVEGNRENIKITTPFDLLIAQSLHTCLI